MFIRPAASASWYEKENDMEWETSDPFDEEPVSPAPEIRLISQPCPSRDGCLPATPTEALWFWLAGGWDD